MEEMKMRGKLKKFVSALVAAGVLMSGMTVPVFAADRGALVYTDFNWPEASNPTKYWPNPGFWSDWCKDENNMTFSVGAGYNIYGKTTTCSKLSMKIKQEPADYTVGANLAMWTNGEKQKFYDSKYLLFSFDLAMSSYVPKGNDTNMELKVHLVDKDGTWHNDYHMLGFSNGLIKLAGEWVDYKYEAETWMRIQYVFDRVNSTIDAYINGVKLVDGKNIGFDINGKDAAIPYIKFTALDTKTGITPREQDLFIDTLVVKFYDTLAEIPEISQYNMQWENEQGFEISSKANGITGVKNNIIYGGVNMTANEFINTVNAPEGAELSVVQENKNDGNWRQQHYVGGDNSVEPVVNEAAHPNKLTETWLRMKLPAISGKRMARIIYFPIADSRVLSTTYSDGAALNGYYIPEQPINITVASSANGANVKAMVVQYSKNGELARCETHDFVSALKTPETITFTPAADSGDVKIYLWNDGMQAFDTAQVLNAAP